MAKNMYGASNQNYVVLGNSVYRADNNGLILNVQDGDAAELQAQRCIDEDAWLKLQAAHPGGGGATSVYFEAAASDETTQLTTGVNLLTFRTPYAFTLTAARASLSTAGSSQTAVDVNMNGASIFSTVLTIDASSRTSIGATVPPVLLTTAIPDNAEFTIDIDTAGTSAAGLKVVLIGTVP